MEKVCYKKALMLLIILVFNTTLYAKSNSILLDSTINTYELTPEDIKIYATKYNNLSFEDIKSNHIQKAFLIPIDSIQFEKGMTYWLRMHFYNASNEHRRWKLYTGGNEFVHAYEKTVNNSWKEHIVGTLAFPTKRTEIIEDKQSIYLEMIPKEQKIIYVRVFNSLSPSSYNFKLQAVQTKALVFWNSPERLQDIMIFLSGIFMIMGVYNFLVYITSQDKAYFYYALYIFFIFLSLLNQSTSFYNFLFRTNDLGEYCIMPLFSFIMTAFYFLFFLSFLDIKVAAPKSYHLLKKIPTFSIIGVIIHLALLLFTSISPIIIQVFSLFVSLLISVYTLVLVIKLYRKSDTAARFFCLGSFILQIGYYLTFIFAFTLPHIIILSYTIYYAMVLEVICFSLGLGYRVKSTEKEKQQVQLKLQKTNQNLTREIVERLKANDERKLIIKDLEKSNKELQQYAYIVAHDLKEPLRNISSFATLLERRYTKKLDDTAKEFMGYIVKNTIHMDSLLTDLLNYSSLGKSNTYKQCKIENIIENVQLNLRTLLQQSQAKIVVGKMPILKVNPAHFTQLFQNLIQNAIKFRSQKPCIIKIEAVIQKDHQQNKVVFSVKDNGIGIAKDYQKQIFQIFKRLDRHKYEGTGIGLAICEKIVKIYEGKIWLTSAEGKGSIFYFSLPISLLAQEKPVAETTHVLV